MGKADQVREYSVMLMIAEARKKDISFLPPPGKGISNKRWDKIQLKAFEELGITKEKFWRIPCGNSQKVERWKSLYSHLHKT